MAGPQPGSMMHAESKMSDSVIMLVHDFPKFGQPGRRAPSGLGGTTAYLYL
jgi:hypothetical protein